MAPEWGYFNLGELFPRIFRTKYKSVVFLPVGKTSVTEDSLTLILILLACFRPYILHHAACSAIVSTHTVLSKTVSVTCVNCFQALDDVSLPVPGLCIAARV